jgi:hypothetical protein
VTIEEGARQLGGQGGDSHLRSLISRTRPRLLTLGLLGTFWSASRSVDGVRRALNLAYGVKESRPLWRTEVVTWGMTFAGALLVLVAASALVAGGGVGEWIAGKLEIRSGFLSVMRWLRWPILVIAFMTATGLAYRFLPETKPLRFVGRRHDPSDLALRLGVRRPRRRRAQCSSRGQVVGKAEMVAANRVRPPPARMPRRLIASPTVRRFFPRRARCDDALCGARHAAAGHARCHQMSEKQIGAEGGKAAAAVWGAASTIGSVVFGAAMMLIALYYRAVAHVRLTDWLDGLGGRG